MKNELQNLRPHAVKSALTSNRDVSWCVQEIIAQLGNEDFAFVLLFYSHDYATSGLSEQLQTALPETRIYGCSTAGELSHGGFADGSVVALGFMATDFRVHDVFFPNLDAFSIREGQREARRAASEFGAETTNAASNCFALMLVDGLCYREEQLVSAINFGIRNIPLVGGSAGDGMRFKETSVVHRGQMHSNAAVMLLIESQRPLHIFKCESFHPTETKLVVTKADPDKRLVYELNAMPAARAYANAIGVLPSQLDQMSFALHPLSVCFGGDCYVRSIQEVRADGAMRFFCAIDEGIVFTMSEVDDLVSGLESTMDGIKAAIGPPQMVLAFDCVFRRMMAESNQSKGQINRILRENRVTGFSTYGEQVHGMHVNLTFTGIAIGQ